MTTLPSDLDVARQLTSIRVAVIEATMHLHSPKRSTRYRTTRNLIIAGAAIAALTAGAIAAFQADSGSVDSYAACYRTGSLENPQFVVGAHGAAADPVEMCSVLWSHDLWESSNHGPDSEISGRPIPPLVACTGRDGIAAVFPREGSTASVKDFCRTLGLADWGPD